MARRTIRALRVSSSEIVFQLIKARALFQGVQRPLELPMEAHVAHKIAVSAAGAKMPSRKA